MVVVVETFGAIPERDRVEYPPFDTAVIVTLRLFAGFVPPNIVPANTKLSPTEYPLPAYALATCAAEYILPVSDDVVVSVDVAAAILQNPDIVTVVGVEDKTIAAVNLFKFAMLPAEPAALAIAIVDPTGIGPGFAVGNVIVIIGLVDEENTSDVTPELFVNELVKVDPAGAVGIVTVRDEVLPNVCIRSGT